MESIEIKNFGPIKHAKLDLKDINVFIGTTGSGKSTVAKLIDIFRSVEFLSGKNVDNLVKLLSNHNIYYKLSHNTFIEYRADGFLWKLKNNRLHTDFPFSEAIESFISALGWIIDDVYDENSHKDFKKVKFASIAVASLLIEENISPENRNERTEGIYQLVDLLAKKRKEFTQGVSIDIRLTDEDVKVVFANLAGKIGFDDPLYIPAERTLLSMIGQSIFGLMENRVTIAESIKYFGSEFELARKQLTQFHIDSLGVVFEYANDINAIILKDGTKIKLEQASSGFQSIIPLLLVVQARTNRKDFIKNYIIIEEPELNLYPTVQKDLTEFIVERINKSGDKLIITTHSPYVLTTLDNLIQAQNAVRENPEAEEKVKEMVPPERWVDFDRVTCYYFKDGKCHSTLDQEFRSIGPSNIDDVSIELGKTFDELLDLKYAKVL